MNDQKLNLVDISPKIAETITRSDRKQRYFTYDLKTERILIDGERVTIIPSREDSYDRLLELGYDFAAEEKNVEDIVLESIMRERLLVALTQLNDGERRLIEEIFFSYEGGGKTEREAAESLGIPRMTLHSRKIKIFAKLKSFLEK